MVFVFLVLLMPNLLVLCQGCFAWVEPHSQLCPECGIEIDLERPDLDRETLAGILGRPLMTLGSVRVDRRDLPSFGELIGTSTGLLFVPRLHRRLNERKRPSGRTRIVRDHALNFHQFKISLNVLLDSCCLPWRGFFYSLRLAFGGIRCRLLGRGSLGCSHPEYCSLKLFGNPRIQALS